MVSAAAEVPYASWCLAEPSTGVPLSTNLNASLVNIKIGDTAVPLKSIPQCKVCSSRMRFEVEKGLAQGRTYRAIVRNLPENAGLNEDNVRSHYANGHLPIQQAAVQEVADRHGRELGKAFEPATTALADHLSLACEIVARVRDRLASGQEQPTLRDGLAAVRLLAETQSVVSDQRGIGAYVAAMSTMIETVRDHVSDETFAAIGQDLAASPLVRPIATGRPD